MNNIWKVVNALMDDHPWMGWILGMLATAIAWVNVMMIAWGLYKLLGWTP